MTNTDKKGSDTLWLVAIVLSSVGLALSVVLARGYYLHVLGGRVSECAITTFIDCDRVNESRFATLAGIPNALLSVGSHLALIGLLVAGRLVRAERVRRGTDGSALILSAVGAAAAVGLALVSLLVIRALCIYCALLQLADITLFALLFRRNGGWRLRQGLEALWPPSIRGIVTTTAAVVVIALVVVILGKGLSATGSRALLTRDDGVPSVLLGKFYGAKIIDFDTADSPVLGESGGDIQVVVFSDFTCHYCLEFDSHLRDLVAEFDGRVRLVYKFFPLDGRCNPHLPESAEATGCQAAAAAYAAFEQGKFWEYSDVLFENFRRHTEEQLVSYGVSVGMEDTSAIRRALNDPAVYRRLARDVEEGFAAGVEGTPTVFVNGLRLDTARLRAGDTRYGILKATIKELLRE